jgi:LPS export ABC transporter protein LptC
MSCLLLLAPLSGCSEVEPPAQSDLSDVPVQTTYEYHTTQTQLGVPLWELWGSSAQRYIDDPLLHLTDVRMQFFREGVSDATLTSQSGEVDENTYDTVARGDVVVVTEDGRILRSEILYWDNARELIHTDQFVHFTDGDQVLTGYGLETDPNLTNLLILEQVSGSASADAAEGSTGNEEEQQ